MGIFDSIKNAFSKSESDQDVSTSPSQMLRDAGIDPGGLKFGFGNHSITVSGEIGEESERQQILDVLSGAEGINSVQDNMVVAAPAEAVQTPAVDPAPEVSPPAEAVSPEPDAQGEGERSYTVESGDTLWKIAEQMYGNGSKYMKIFEANTDQLENPDRIFPGQKLRIPG